MNKLTPLAREFVVSANEASELEALTDSVPPDARVEPLPGDWERRIVWIEEATEQPTRNWARLRSLLGSRFRVLPVLADSAGRQSYPTGRVQVRFKRPITDAALTKFAERHHLRLLARNEFQPEQAVFEPESDDMFLMEVVDDAGEDQEVRLAWPETKARYSKV